MTKKLIVVQESSHCLKQIQPQRTNKSRSARGLSPKNPYLENQCQIRLSLATSLSITKPRPRDILMQIKVADFEEIETLMVFFYHVLHRKRATCFCVAPKNIDNSQSPDFYWNLQIFGLPTPEFQCFKVERSAIIFLRRKRSPSEKLRKRVLAAKENTEKSAGWLPVLT